jgi:glucosamine-6-phosphate deaminase
MITISENEQIFDQTAASRVTDQIISNPDSVIGLSTGRTTGNMHRLIADRCRKGDIDTSRVTFFGVDEITDVPREYYGSCYRMIRSEMLDQMDFDDKNFLMLPTFSDDFDQACKDFVKEIERRGGVDLLILGLGENGHLGFNQPQSPYEKDAWVTDMNPELLDRVRREVGENGDYKGITLGLQMIMNSRRIILVAKGAHKANAVKLMLKGNVSTDFPASLLQRHPDCEFLLDSAAASLLNE